MPMQLNLKIAYQKLLFWNDASALVAKYAGLAQPGSGTPNLYLSLHFSDPSGGNQTTNETAYPSYARLDVPRTSADWNVDADAIASNINTQTFPAATGATTDIITHIGLGTDSAGTGQIVASSSLSVPIQMANGAFAQFAAGGIRFLFV